MQVERIDWQGNRVWVFYDGDLDLSSRIDEVKSQFKPSFSVSYPGACPVTDARIVAGRGWSEHGCRVVRLTLGQVHREESSTSLSLHDAQNPGETVWLNYTRAHRNLAKYRLRERDLAGADAPPQVGALERDDFLARSVAARAERVLPFGSVVDERGVVVHVAILECLAHPGLVVQIDDGVHGTPSSPERLATLRSPFPPTKRSAGASSTTNAGGSDAQATE